MFVLFLGGNCATHTTCGDCARFGCQWNNAQNSFCHEQCQSGNCISSVNSNQCSSVVVPGEKSLMILNIMRIERVMLRDAFLFIYDVCMCVCVYCVCVCMFVCICVYVYVCVCVSSELCSASRLRPVLSYDSEWGQLRVGGKRGMLYHMPVSAIAMFICCEYMPKYVCCSHCLVCASLSMCGVTVVLYVFGKCLT